MARPLTDKEKQQQVWEVRCPDLLLRVTKAKNHALGGLQALESQRQAVTVEGLEAILKMIVADLKGEEVT